jgi:2-polyprenyl-3-methyl-5-hydroxy-6-metoxy-1,4-benzoquinol methylase
MPDLPHPLSIVGWLTMVRTYFEETAPDLLPLFHTYAEEAAFGRRYIDLDLQRLLPGSKVLEVGAGSMLLSCQLVREGLAVTGLEPTGFGFAHFYRMRELILECAKTQGCLPEILDSTAEALTLSGCFDYAFSVNVMEHVHDVKLTLTSVSKSLKPGATYRFTCPNYLFPYEPHFNIPTFFSKHLTERLLHRKIHARAIPDPSGLWKSLNWINVAGIRRLSKRMRELKVTFNTAFLVSTLERVASDPDFAERRSPLTREIILLLVKFRLHHLFRFMPAIVQPVIDCRVEKILRSEKK